MNDKKNDIQQWCDAHKLKHMIVHSCHAFIFTDNRHSLQACVAMFSFVSSRNEMKWISATMYHVIAILCHVTDPYWFGFSHQKKRPVSVNGSTTSHHIHHLQWENIRVGMGLVLVFGFNTWKRFLSPLDCIWIADFFCSFAQTANTRFIHSNRLISFAWKIVSFADWQLFRAIAHPIDSELWISHCQIDGWMVDAIQCILKFAMRTLSCIHCFHRTMCCWH